MAELWVQHIARVYFGSCARWVIIGPEEILFFIYGGVRCQSNLKREPTSPFLPGMVCSELPPLQRDTPADR